MANAQVGNIEWGAGTIGPLATVTAYTLFPPQNITTMTNQSIPPTAVPALPSMVNRDRSSMALLVIVAADKAFNLDYQFTPDSGANWFIGQQIASSTVTVDGGTAGYTNAAVLNAQVGYEFRVQIWDTAGTSLNAAYEWRLYSDNS